MNVISRVVEKEKMSHKRALDFGEAMELYITYDLARLASGYNFSLLNQWSYEWRAETYLYIRIPEDIIVVDSSLERRTQQVCFFIKSNELARARGIANLLMIETAQKGYKLKQEDIPQESQERIDTIVSRYENRFSHLKLLTKL